MGFNLKSFFEELEYILNDDINYKETHRQITELVAEQKKYAKECNQL